MAVAPKVKPELAALLLLAPEPKTNGATAAPVVEDVVAGLLSWEKPNDWDAVDSAELPKAVLLTVLLACPNTKGVGTGAGLEEEVTLPNTLLLLAEVVGTAVLEELELKKLKDGFAAPWSAGQNRTRNAAKHWSVCNRDPVPKAVQGETLTDASATMQLLWIT